MTIQYDQQVLDDLKQIEPLQARMLLDYFEHKHDNSQPLTENGKVFISGKWRILFNQIEKEITVLRIIT